MARTKIKTRKSAAAAHKGVAHARARKKTAMKSTSKARPQHKFVFKRFRPMDFKSDGLRTYAEYRDLGIKDATAGMVLAHAIRFVAPCDPKVVSKEHYHDTEFQMIYVLKGSVTSSFEGQGTHTMTAGDCWLQPQRIRHKVLDYSEDCELLEVVMPADFKTIELEK